MREVWTEDEIHHDSGYYDVVELYGPLTDFEDSLDRSAGCKLDNEVCIHYFDAGGGALGFEFLYRPPERFHHNAIVYIHIEVYDVAPDPNRI